MKMVIGVLKDSNNRYLAARCFESLGDDFLTSHSVFTLKQNENESIPDFEERVRQEARKRGIAHIERLD